MNKLKIKKIHQEAMVPNKATDGSACFDLCCCEGFSLSSSSLMIVKTGLVFEIPDGYHIEICPRSGMAKRELLYLIHLESSILIIEERSWLCYMDSL